MPQKETFDWMRQQLNGHMRTQIIAAAATLSLADHLQDGPRTVDEIARITGLDRGITFRLLRALATIGLVASEDEHTFHSLPPLETLLPAAPGSLRQLAMVFATPAQYLPWGYFLQGLKTGLPQATTALGSDIFDYYAHHPEEGAIFQKTMQAITADVTAEIGQRLDTSKSLRAVDVGGATGSLLYSLMQVNPNLRGIVYDRPENVSQAQAGAISLGLSERSAVVAGDFFESVPAGDLYLLRFILHDWSDEDCIRILKNCRRAMLPNSRLVLVESFLGRVGQDVSHDIADTQGAIIDLHMFVAVGGRERSVSQYEHLLRQADLSMTATTPLPSGYVLMEVVARTSARPHIFGAWYPDASAWPHGGSPIMSSCNPEFIQTTQPSFDDVPASGAMEGGGACNKHAKLQAGVRHLHRRVRKGPLGALRSTMEISRSLLPIMIVASEELTGSHADRYQNIAIARRTGSSYPRLPHRSGDRRLQSILPGTLA